MKQKFTAQVARGSDGYLISEIAELPGCHTQGKTGEELVERTEEAISLYLDSDRSIEVRIDTTSL